LGGEEYLAIASNARKRSGVEQLFNLLGSLFVNGKPVDLGRLYQGIDCRQLDFARPLPQPSRGLPLKNTMPVVHVDESLGQLLRELFLPLAAAPAQPLAASPAAP